jgi:hypothetical protein
MIRQGRHVALALVSGLLLMAGMAWAGQSDTHTKKSRSDATRQSQTQASREPGAAMTATVLNMNQQQRSLTLATSGGSTIELQVSPELLGTLVEGDRVEVTIRQTPASQPSGTHPMPPTSSEQAP